MLECFQCFLTKYKQVTVSDEVFFFFPSQFWIHTLFPHCSDDHKQRSSVVGAVRRLKRYTLPHRRCFWRGLQQRNRPPSRPSVCMFTLHGSIHHFLSTEIQKTPHQHTHDQQANESNADQI